jgi:hypothetical protein
VKFAIIIGNTESKVKKHILEVFEKRGVETGTAASLHGGSAQFRSGSKIAVRNRKASRYSIRNSA